MKNKNSAVRCVVVLLSIAIICVALLAVLNDVLYVAPDMSVFNKAVEGEYSEGTLEKVSLTNGKIELVVNGKLKDGTEVVGMYVTGNKYGKSDSFQIAVVVSMADKKIVGLYEIVDGSTGGYAWDESRLQNMVGKVITSTNFIAENGLVITGTTNSSIAVKQALQTAAEYFTAVYAK